MPQNDLAQTYRAYIDCLNAQAWNRLGDFVRDAVHHNGRRLGLAGYRQMLERDFLAIPDLCFTIGLLVCEPPHVASRLRFDCTPGGTLFGLPVDGRRVQFDENVFYEFVDGKIAQVWSIIDTAAIARQIDA